MPGCVFGGWSAQVGAQAEVLAEASLAAGFDVLCQHAWNF